MNVTPLIYGYKSKEHPLRYYRGRGGGGREEKGGRTALFHFGELKTVSSDNRGTCYSMLGRALKIRYEIKHSTYFGDI